MLYCIACFSSTTFALVPLIIGRQLVELCIFLATCHWHILCSDVCIYWRVNWLIDWQCWQRQQVLATIVISTKSIKWEIDKVVLTDFQSSSYLLLKPLMTSFTSDRSDAITELSWCDSFMMSLCSATIRASDLYDLTSPDSASPPVCDSACTQVTRSHSGSRVTWSRGQAEYVSVINHTSYVVSFSA